MIERSEITEPKHDNQYWITYWIKMNGKLGANHFGPQLQEMKENIEKNGCNELFDNVKLCGNESWLMKEWGEKFCPACKNLIKQIDDSQFHGKVKA